MEGQDSLDAVDQARAFFAGRFNFLGSFGPHIKNKLDFKATFCHKMLLIEQKPTPRAGHGA